jgi:hypothetical protein
MDLSDLQAALRIRPFKPFRLYVSGNETFDVRHSELCVPGYTSVFIGFPSRADADSPVYSRYTIIDLAHIIRLEPLETAPATAGNSSEG